MARGSDSPGTVPPPRARQAGGCIAVGGGFGAGAAAEPAAAGGFGGFGARPAGGASSGAGAATKSSGFSFGDKRAAGAAGLTLAIPSQSPGAYFWARRLYPLILARCLHTRDSNGFMLAVAAATKSNGFSFGDKPAAGAAGPTLAIPGQSPDAYLWARRLYPLILAVFTHARL